MDFLSLRRTRLSCEPPVVTRSEERRLYLQASFTQESCRHLHRQSVYLFIIFSFSFSRAGAVERQYQLLPVRTWRTFHHITLRMCIWIRLVNCIWECKLILMVKPLPPSPSYLQRPIIPVQYPGKGAGPLFLNQTAVEGSKTTFGDAPPLCKGLDSSTAPPPHPPPPPLRPSISRSGSGIVCNSNFSLICDNVDGYFVFFCQCTC